jgi:hypothetical protein
MNNWIPTIATVLGGLGAAFAPQIQVFVSHNPGLTTGIATILGVILHLLPSPVTPKP